MTKKLEDESNQLNLTVVALVALVAIVGLVALVLSAAKADMAHGNRLVSAQEGPGFEDSSKNIAGEGRHPGDRMYDTQNG